MRYIYKGLGDIYLQRRYERLPAITTESQATSAWSNFHKKKRTSNICCTEQFNLCGYSELSIDDKSPIFDEKNTPIILNLGHHLEHVEPKSKFPKKTFDHKNLIVSAISSYKLKQMAKCDVFGGHSKINWFDHDAFINPLMNNCAEYFHYLSSGKIVPSEKLKFRRDKARARLTIYKLNLNSNYLVNLRKTWINKTLEIAEKLDDNNLKLFAESELLPIADKLRPFHSALRQSFGTLGDRICIENNI